MNKKVLLLIIIIFTIFINLCSCTLFQKPIDDKSGFSNSLKKIEEYIRNDDWGNAKISLNRSNEIWKKIKPIFQIDIDHDYVKDIENNFSRLKGYIETKEKADSLATIILIQDTWSNINSF